MVIKFKSYIIFHRFCIPLIEEKQPSVSFNEAVGKTKLFKV